MRLAEIASRVPPTRLKYAAREVPHGTIEPNRTCNIRCRNCYNLDTESVKELDLVKREVDLLASRRRLQVISLVGGEPTLHPDLYEIVRYIKSRKIACQLLTNGIALLGEGGGRLLDTLVEAGLDRIVVHIDRGQEHVHGDIEKARRELFAELESRRIRFSLALTIEPETQGEIAGLARRYASYRYFDGILGVLARDPLRPDAPKVEMSNVYAWLSLDLGVEPAAYIPSNANDEDVHWLIFLYLIDARTGRTVGLPPPLDRAWRKVHCLLKGRQAFVVGFRPFWARLLAFPICLGRALSRAAEIPDLVQFLRRSALKDTVRFHYIALQCPPEFEELTGRIRLCHQCPDATIRNGRLTPVCLADKMSPLNGHRPPLRFPEDAVRAVYDHLEAR